MVLGAGAAWRRRRGRRLKGVWAVGGAAMAAATGADGST
eukprot:gene28056-48105_t